VNKIGFVGPLWELNSHKNSHTVYSAFSILRPFHLRSRLGGLAPHRRVARSRSATYIKLVQREA
jgi:hypothetical protein